VKRYLALLLCAVFLLAFGCMSGYPESEEQKGITYDLYFLADDLQKVPGGGALQTEHIVLPEDMAGQPQKTAETLVRMLVDGPRSEHLKSTLPSGTALQSVQIDGMQATVDFSTAYASLSGVALTMADYAVALTLVQIPEILSVRITVRGRELAYRDKQVFTTRDILLAPAGDVVGTVDAVLFYLRENGALAAEESTLELYEGDTQVGVVTRALENGSENKELSTPFPEGFRVRSVWQEGGTCYVNLSSALVETLPRDGSVDQALRALGRSLCSLESVLETRFLVDGEFVPKYGDANIAGSYLG